MNIDLVLREEQQKRKEIKKQAGKAVLISFFACSLVFVFQLVCSFILGTLATLYLDDITITAAFLIDISFYVFYICIPFLIASLFFKHFLANPTPFKLKRSSPKKPVLFVIGALGTTYLLNLLIALLFPSVNDLPSQTTIIANTPVDIVLSIFMYAVLPAVIEEWAFRGVLLKNLLPYGKWGAIIISSILFGFGHIHPRSIINALIFGVILGISYEYTRSLKLPMLIHFINNAISTVVSLIPLESLLAILISLTIYIFMGCAIGAIIYYAGHGYKRHRFSLLKPDVLGYKLSVIEYLNKFVFNIGIIPYILLFGLYFYLAFYV